MQDQVPNQDEPGRNEASPDPTATEAHAPLVLPKPGFVARIKNYLLDLDASLDFGLFRGFRLAREAFERYRDIMDRFHIAGWRRWLIVEPLSEMATMGLGGLVLMLALAGPAFRETSDEDWLKKSELAVTFLDRYGNEIGRRGIKHSRFGPARRVARSPDQGGARHRGPALLRAFRHRHRRHVPRRRSPTRAPAASSRAAPRSPSSSPRTCS